MIASSFCLELFSYHFPVSHNDLPSSKCFFFLNYSLMSSLLIYEQEKLILQYFGKDCGGLYEKSVEFVKSFSSPSGEILNSFKVLSDLKDQWHSFLFHTFFPSLYI